MTLLQDEQEKPQSKAGPTRHAKIMRGIVTPIFGLLAVACIVLGVLNATIWKPSTQVTASAAVTGSQYVVTDPNVLQLVDDHVNISAKSRDKSANVCIAIGSAREQDQIRFDRTLFGKVVARESACRGLAHDCASAKRGSFRRADRHVVDEAVDAHLEPARRAGRGQ